MSQILLKLVDVSQIYLKNWQGDIILKYIEYNLFKVNMYAACRFQFFSM